jgi:hypothetical protein
MDHISQVRYTATESFYSCLELMNDNEVTECGIIQLNYAMSFLSVEKEEIIM